MSAALTFIATCDLASITRGRSIRTADYAARRRTGVGWVPADLALTTFGDIATPNPFGALGDTRLVPVESARVTLPAHGARTATDLILADIVESDGRPWPACPRTVLVETVAALAAAGLTVLASFEQEFTLSGPGDEAAGVQPFSIEAHRLAEPFGTNLMERLADAGLGPETWLPEYGRGQYEITLTPTDPVGAADRAILVRALVRDLASTHGLRASFAPLGRPDSVGNGVHLHLSLWDRDGRPATIDSAGGVDPLTARFVAGILDHAPAVIAWTAPSVISALRLTPHRWSAAASFFGRQNREAMVRLCPVLRLGGADPAASANIEYRAADATANPWLALAAVLRAGLDGLERELPGAPLVGVELDALDQAQQAQLGIGALPQSLDAALTALEADGTAAGWFGPVLLATHIAIRRTEEAALADASPEERCRRYANVI